MNNQMASVEYNDQNLQQLFAELEPKRRVQALRGGFRREANQVRKTAVNNLRRSIRSDRDLEKGIRAIVFKRKAGFRVTVGTKRGKKNGRGEAGFHTNRKGLKKPVLIWAESGTKERRTKSSLGSFLKKGRKKGGHSTGKMKRYGFMEQTLGSTKGTVTEDIRQMVLQNVERTSKKYGCK